MLDVILATIAGFVSFISPCVLPLVPAYIGYMSGRVTHTVAAQVSVSAGGAAQLPSPSLAMRFSMFLHGLAFVAGFTFVFTTLGILGTAFIRQIGSTNTVEGLIGRIGGVMIIFFGLHFMGVIPAVFARLRKTPFLLSSAFTSIVFALAAGALIAWGFSGTVALWDTGAYVGWTGTVALVIIALVLLGLIVGGAFVNPGVFWNKLLNTVEMGLYADTRRQMDAHGNQGLSGSALMGVVFAAGWTPCIGPTLGAAMTMAANGGDVGKAAVLMTAYSLGLGGPFLLTALLLDSAQGGLRRLKKHMNTIKLVSGAFLVLIGYWIASGQLQSISRDFSQRFGDISVRLEECTVGAFEGEIGWDQYPTCLDGEVSFYDLREQHTGIGMDGRPVQNTDDGQAAVDEPAARNVSDVQSITGVLAEAGPAIGLSVGSRAPNFETTTISGEPVSLADFRGQVVLLNFWFTDCVPCRLEMPEFQRAYEAYADDGLVILAVNREESAEAIEAFSDPLGLTFPLLLDESGDINFLYDVRGYPSTFVIDREGIIRYRSYSALTAKQIQEQITAALS